MLANSWKAYFIKMYENNVSDRRLLMFQKALGIGLTLEQRMDRLVKNTDYIVMSVSPIQVSSRLRKMKLYHSFANLRGTFHNPNIRIVALDGFRATATPMIIQAKDLEANFEVVAPNFEALVIGNFGEK